MKNESSHNQEQRLRRPYLIVGCLFISLLLHLLLVWGLKTKPPATPQPEQTVIDLVDIRLPPADTETEPQPSYEIDHTPLLPEPELEVESVRRAEHDQLVEREQAPEGDDSRDQRREDTTVPTVGPQPPAPQPTPPPVTATPPFAPATIPAPDQPQPDIATKPTPDTQPADQPLDLVDPEPQRLTRDQLFPSPDRLAEIAQGQQADRDRIRERDDTEIGDEIWLNLQHDRLVSFFRRFHDRVERVWNYPVEAAMNGVEGTLELLIIVSKEGELIDVDLRRTSGSDLLDFEAIQAVYRAAPFGPLGRHYPHDELRIRAYFRYRISGRYIFGR